jgi:hypothetical protein
MQFKTTITRIPKKKNICLIFLITAVLFFLSGCSSLSQLVERGGRALNGSAFAEKTLAKYRADPGGNGAQPELQRIRRRDGSEYITITVAGQPNLRLNGTVPDNTGRFYLESLYFFCPNLTGWNEFTLGLSGSGYLISAGIGYLLNMPRTVEWLDIIEGKIRRNETRKTGDQALTALRNRQERIIALTEWMQEQDPGDSALNQEAFAAHWKRILFPELVGEKDRPSGWNAPESGDQWVRADEIRWNRNYTELVFPEELWPVRDSGTLLRDWEEALPWIYLQFEWNTIIETLSGEIHLALVK